MSLSFARWPLLATEPHSPEQEERWWTECYLPSPAEITLRGVTHSVIVSGGPGSGKSVALARLARVEAERLLLVSYPVIHWPGQPHAWAGGVNHFGQIMARTSLTLKDILTRQPDRLNKLSEVNLEFLRWLIEKYQGQRAFRRWADALNQPKLLDTLEQPWADLYTTNTALADVQGQIEELVTLSRRLGFEGVVVLVDVNQAEAAQKTVLEQIGDLFGWLTPLQFEGFALKAAVPAQVIEQARLLDKSRGRVNFASLRWMAEDCREIARRYLRLATDDTLNDLTDLAEAALWATLEADLEAIYQAPSPQGWLNLTLILLEAYETFHHPLTSQQHDDLLYHYYLHFVPLKLDQQAQPKGVWRGHQFIVLEEQPFSFLEILWQYRHTPEAEVNKSLLKMAGSQGNLNTLASRVRKKIEPLPGKTIYLFNSRSQGYWLEHVAED